jgi:succinate-semialdehyde dehydrogenase / glutarate-semialdehyde dehydrogenase
MLFIDGEWVPAGSGRTFESHNPATGELLGTVADAGADDTARAIDAASRALVEWRRTTAHERAALLYEAHRLMLERSEDLAHTMTAEQGKPIRMARNEVRYAADFLLWFAEEAKRTYGETIPSARRDQRFLVMHQPVGVAVAITPWNYPISMITRKVAPAVAAGCTIVLKAAEQTPLCAVKTFEVLQEAGIPNGVVNLISASDPEPVGEAMLDDHRVRKVSFTGSTEVGQMINARAAADMKRVSMELGGHAPFIVFDDADPVHAAKGAVAVKLLNTGQACICPNRLFVQRSIAEPFLATLQERMEKLVAGSGFEDGVTVGPLIDEGAIEKMALQVEDAVSQGATLHLGGHRLTGERFDCGTFWAPTLLSEVSPTMRIYREETFGPIAPVMVFDDDDEVIAMANDTEYGLASYIYTQNLSRAFRTAEDLDFGIIGVNDINPTSAAVPFGGIKHSGLGREGARVGLEEYLDIKVVGMSL